MVSKGNTFTNKIVAGITAMCMVFGIFSSLSLNNRAFSEEITQADTPIPEPYPGGVLYNDLTSSDYLVENPTHYTKVTDPLSQYNNEVPVYKVTKNYTTAESAPPALMFPIDGMKDFRIRTYANSRQGYATNAIKNLVTVQYTNSDTPLEEGTEWIYCGDVTSRQVTDFASGDFRMYYVQTTAGIPDEFANAKYMRITIKDTMHHDNLAFASVELVPEKLNDKEPPTPAPTATTGPSSSPEVSTSPNPSSSPEPTIEPGDVTVPVPTPDPDGILYSDLTSPEYLVSNATHYTKITDQRANFNNEVPVYKVTKNYTAAESAPPVLMFPINGMKDFRIRTYANSKQGYATSAVGNLVQVSFTNSETPLDEGTEWTSCGAVTSKQVTDFASGDFRMYYIQTNGEIPDAFADAKYMKITINDTMHHDNLAFVSVELVPEKLYIAPPPPTPTPLPGEKEPNYPDPIDKPATLPVPEPNTFEERSRLILEYIAERGTEEHIPDRAGDASMQYATALFALGGEENIQKALQLVEDWTVSGKAEQGAMFFWYYMMYNYLKFGEYYSPELKDKVKNLFISYGGGLTGTTENHRLMYATAWYLAHQTWPDAEFVGKVTGDDPFGEKFLSDWIVRVSGNGFNEMDSYYYTAFYLDCMIMLYQYAEDPVMSNRAKMIADQILAIGAISYVNGNKTVTQFRTNDFRYGVMESRFEAGMWGMNEWLHFGSSEEFNYRTKIDNVRKSALQASCDYRCPEIIQKIAYDDTQTYVYRSTNDKDGGMMGPWRGFYKYGYITPKFGLASEKSLAGSGVWAQQMFLWNAKWVSDEPNSSFMIYHPDNTKGIQDMYGRTRYEQVLQKDSTLIGVVNIDEATCIYKYLYAPVSNDSIHNIIEEDGWIFMDGGSAFLGVKFIKDYEWLDNDGYYWTGSDQTMFKYLKSAHLKNGYIVEMADPDDYEGETQIDKLNAFKNAILTNTVIDASGIDNTDPVLTYTNLNGDTLKLQFTLQPGGEMYINGQKLDHYNEWPVVESPWVNQGVNDKIMKLEYEGETLYYDFYRWNISEEEPEEYLTPEEEIEKDGTYITVDEKDSSVQFDDSWTLVNDGRSSGGTHHESNKLNAEVEFSFVGSSIAIIGKVANWGGDATVYIDDVEAGTISCNNSSELFQKLLFFSNNLTPGKHSVRVSVNREAWNSWVWIDAFKYKPLLSDYVESKVEIKDGMMTASQSPTAVNKTYDNDETTWWQTDPITEDNPPYLTLTLPEEQYISRATVSIPWGGRSQSFILQTSLDGEEYTTVLDEASYAFTDEQLCVELVLPEPTKAKYLKLIITENTNAVGAAQIGEFKVYGFMDYNTMGSFLNAEGDRVETLDDVQKSNGLVFAANCKNDNEIAENVKLYMVFYADADCTQLLGMSVSDTATIESGQTALLYTDVLPLPQDQTVGAVKAYVWNDNMTPLSDNFVINK